MTTDEIRKLYLDFFVSKAHKILPSASLIPNDPTLLLTGAGMNPFKDFFMGNAKPPSKRVVTTQKCLRTGDVDNVGRTPRHHTFFEMMGNFSFGDYFKKESVEWAWEFSVKWLKLDPEKLWVTIYLDDEEAYDAWRNVVGVPEHKIVRLGEKDNFWPANAPSLGPNGPCGPCSEIFYDRGEAFGCGSMHCGPGCDCERFIEYWNLVFQVFDRQDGGVLVPLSQKNIDTGLGLERTAALLQNVPSNFDIDLFQTMMQTVTELAADGTNFRDPENIRAQRVIVDHARAVVFMIADGVLPSNEGRGYVLRRLLRRAIRSGKILKIQGAFLHKMVPVVIRAMKVGYPELVGSQERVLKIVQLEEEKFDETIEQGMAMLEQVLARSKGKRISGEDAFRLYDTYGFPLELTIEIAEERGAEVDEEGFNAATKAHAERSRGGSEFTGDIWVRGGTLFADLQEKLEPTRFVGYRHLESESMLLAILKDGKEIEKASAGERVQVILDETPFYAEQGGQIGDTGCIMGANLKARVLDTRKADGLVLHDIEILEGEVVLPGVELPSLDVQTVTASVDTPRRAAIRRAHTCTHLLQAALRSVLGSHVAQAGSLVEPDRLRFDFSHFEAITPEEMCRIEDTLNEFILKDKPVETEELPIDEARKRGATALFGEKYGDVVRVVSVPEISMELCGGTHAFRTGQIGLCKIVSESSIGAGLRRIEAVTGMASVKYVRMTEKNLTDAALALKTAPVEVPEKIGKLQEQIRGLEKQIVELRKGQAHGQADDLLATAEQIEGISVITASVGEMDAESAKSLVDGLVEKLKSGAVVLATAGEGKLFFVGKLSGDLIGRGLHMGNIIREVAKVAGGGGGGRPDFAQAGGKDASRVDEALAKAKEVIKEQVRK